ncbi:MAG: CPBP family intramembrane metalloprotease [Pseudomonadota bacterium]|nr:MAG: CPBP family intramembrane metalloprotease [Pseudomonadota bacterium]
MSVLQATVSTAPPRALIRWLTLAAIPLLAALVAAVWLPGFGKQGTETLAYPAQSAARLMERHLYFHEGINQVPAWQRAYYGFLFGSRDDVIAEAIAAYGEVLDYFATHQDRATEWSTTNTRVRLLTLLAETGQWQAFKEQLTLLGDMPEEEVMGEAIRFAYGRQIVEPYLPEIHAGLRMLPNGWAKDKLRLHAYTRANLDDHHRAARTLSARGAELRQQTLIATGVTVAVFVIGLVSAWLLLRRNSPLPWRADAFTTPWAFADGVFVLIWSATLGLGCAVLLATVGAAFGSNILTQWSTLLASLPMLWLIHRCLLKPRNMSLASAFGMQLNAKSLLPLVGITFVVILVERSGALLITWSTWSLGFEPHWSDGLAERWMWGSWENTLLSSVNVVAWAPLFEEIGFRGLLYLTLRTRMKPLPAALLSAGTFSALHLYSLAGFLAVFWSGMVWAVAFERFRSLLPVILAHAGSNLFAVSMVLMFYR